LVLSEITVVRRPNGFLMELTEFTANPQPADQKRPALSGLVGAAMQFDGPR
jgi:hypothetical protein